MKGVELSPWNIPLWVKLSKYNIDSSMIKLEGKYMTMSAGIQCKEVTAPAAEMYAATPTLSGSYTWKCHRKSAKLSIGKNFW